VQHVHQMHPLLTGPRLGRVCSAVKERPHASMRVIGRVGQAPRTTAAWAVILTPFACAGGAATVLTCPSRASGRAACQLQHNL